MTWQDILLYAAIALALFIAVVTAFVPKRVIAFLLPVIFVAPVFVYFGYYFWEAAQRPEIETNFDNALLGFGILSMFLLVPWVGVFILGLAVGGTIRLIRWGIRQRRLAVGGVPAPPNDRPPYVPPQKGDPIASQPLYDAMYAIADRHGFPRESLARAGRDHDGAIPFVYADKRGFVWEQRERGASVDHRVTQDMNEMLYWVFVDATGIAASNHASHVRASPGAWRKTVLDRQAMLLESIDPAWHRRWQDERRRAEALR